MTFKEFLTEAAKAFTNTKPEEVKPAEAKTDVTEATDTKLTEEAPNVPALEDMKAIAEAIANLNNTVSSISNELKDVKDNTAKVTVEATALKAELTAQYEKLAKTATGEVAGQSKKVEFTSSGNPLVDQLIAQKRAAKKN